MIQQPPNTEPLLDMAVNAALGLFKRAYPLPVTPVEGIMFTLVANGDNQTWACEFRTKTKEGTLQAFVEPKGTGPSIHAALTALIDMLATKIKTRKQEDEKAIIASDKVAQLLAAQNVAAVAKTP